jgi:hypothetical protein
LGVVKKRLALLNLLLLALLVVVGARVRQVWIEARKRDEVVLHRPLKQSPPPPYAPLPAVAPLTAASYGDVAQQMLFSADRNPTVIVEEAPPPKMPDLPVYYGLMNLGHGPIAIMSEKSGADHKEVRFGETIGEFTLVSASRNEIVLDWRGEKVVRRPNELMQKVEASQPPPERTAAPPPPATNVSKVTPAATAEPGLDLGGGRRACQPGDTSPAGTVVDGMRKVVRNSPFGQVCQWEAVR